MQDVSVLWGARVVIPPKSEQSRNYARNTCTLRHCKYKKLGKKLCVMGEDLELKCEPIPSVSQVDPQK